MTTQRILPVHRILPVLALTAGLLLLPSRSAAEPTPGKQDETVIKMVCAYLQQAHLARPEIGDEISRRLFQKFLKDLDPTKIYFLKSDIDEFKKYETELKDQLREGDMAFAYKVYNRYLARINERLKLVDEFANAKHDFTAKEALDTDFDHMDYAKDEAELRERWRKRIKFDLLMQRLGEKPLPDAEARQKVLTRYHDLAKRWKQVDNYELMELYLTGLTGSVDPHSNYMSPSTVDDFDIAMKLHLEGIGALLHSEGGQTSVAEVVPGGAAAADGRMKVNDKIIAVAQGDNKFVDVIDMKLREVVKLIRGKRGTRVQLKVIPAGKLEPVVYELTRQTIELKDQEARAEIIEHGKKADGKPYRIGVIDLPSFYADFGSRDGKSATADVKKILKNFEEKGVDGVVLDLRHNGGGALREACALTGLFIDEGPVVQVKGYGGRVQKLDDPEKGIVYGGPLMVLISRHSASASEILAGALQDYGRALIVGDSATHGKGTVQTVIDLASQLGENAPKLGALKLTIQQFYRVNGDSTQNRGVNSDVVLPTLSEYRSKGEQELDHALPFDKVDPVEHEEMGLITPDLKTLLKDRSAQRIKKSADFAKLAKEIDLVKEQKARKSIPLNEQELRAQFSKDEANKAEQKANGLEPDEPVADKGAYKFPRNFFTNEILSIMEDLLQGKKLLTAN
jgi:carboxyl-terminal processing protease